MRSASWGVTFIGVDQAVDSETAAAVRTRLNPVLGQGGHVVLDLRGAGVDGEGLGAILSIQRQLEVHGQRMLLVSEDPRFLSLVERAGVSAAFSVFGDSESALTFARDHPCPAP